MRGKQWAGVLIGGLLLVLGGAALLWARSPAPAPAETSPGSSSTTAYTYVIGEWEGRLAVFLAGQTRPDQVYEVAIASLPAAEQERLLAGIPVEDDATLQRLLEDYTS